jgi:hypothetical protein
VVYPVAASVGAFRNPCAESIQLALVLPRT